MKKGSHRSIETKKKISLSQQGNRNALGKKLSDETRQKMSLSKIGNKNQSNRKDYKHSEETKRKIGLANSIALKGRKLSEKIRRKISEANKGERGNNWQGGKTSINKTLRNTIEFKLWREAIFKRDNYICRMCNKRGGKLHSHHLLGFAKFPELRFAINNGITLCEKCHKKIHWR